MVIKFSDEVQANVSRMDKQFDTYANAINLNLQMDESFSIDQLVDLVHDNNNNFAFAIGTEEVEGYALISAAESYDAHNDMTRVSISFQKTV